MPCSDCSALHRVNPNFFLKKRIGLSKGIDPARINNRKECIVYHHWFFNHGLEFQDSVCNGCHDLMMLHLNISDIVIITVKGFDYRCIIHVNNE